MVAAAARLLPRLGRLPALDGRAARPRCARHLRRARTRGAPRSPTATTSSVSKVDNPLWARPFDFPLLGTDNLGRPVWDQLVYGARISLLVGLAATVIAIVIGSSVGIVSGFFGGWVSAVLMRLTEWFLVIPFLPLAIVLAAILGPSVQNVIFVIGITSWPGTARVIRAQVLTLKQRLYVDRSRALGASNRHVMSRHIFPNVAPLILANLTLTVPIAILSETDARLPRPR